MDFGVISVRYARALLKSAIEQKQEDLIYQQMQQLAEVYVSVPELRFTIDNPMLSHETKQKLIETACVGEANVPELTRRFIKLVLDEDRENALQFIAASYITLYRRQKHITQGKITTAAPISAETEAQMKQLLESKTQGTVEFKTEVDPDLIGGFVLEYDTYRMDASVKTKLREILATLKK